MDNDSDSGADILNDLLSNDDENNSEENTKENSEEITSSEIQECGNSRKAEFNFLDCESNVNNENKVTNNQVVTEIYDDKIDSSDDEDRRYFEEQKYTDYGREIKHLLKAKEPEKKEESIGLSQLGRNTTSHKTGKEKNSKSFSFDSALKSTVKTNCIDSTATIKKDVYSDPFFGLRIVSPLISSAELTERMQGKEAVTVGRVKSFIAADNIDNDWVIAGVLISKSDTRTSQNGNKYCIWKLSDLSDDLKTVSVFLFSSAFKTFWKTTAGTVVGVLNSKVLESKDNRDQASLSVDKAQQIMIFGKSKDMGKCKSVKKNGDTCNAVINVSRCEYCVYHVKQEYKKCSRRADIQSANYAGFTGDISKRKTQQNLSKPFHQQMQPFTPIYAKRDEKQYAKDQERLALLSGSRSVPVKPQIKKTEEESVKKGERVELTSQQMKKDFERLNKLRGWKPSLQLTSPTGQPLPPVKESPNNVQSPAVNAEKNVFNKLSLLSGSPRLGAGTSSGIIDFSEPITKKHKNAAKMNALKWVQENGKIKAKDPNKACLSKEKKSERGTKREREGEQREEQPAKKSNISAEKFKEMMEATSSHTDLIEKRYENEQEKYFTRLELKEKMEEKMLTTFKVECKAVRCSVCKYTAFSASDMCKERKHPLRVIKAIKSFFKCSDCGNRTVSLDRIPSHSCIKCNSSSWVRTAMMDERKTNIAGATLSIRGDEEQFVGSMVKDANLNLLVPE